MLLEKEIEKILNLFRTPFEIFGLYMKGFFTASYCSLKIEYTENQLLPLL